VKAVKRIAISQSNYVPWKGYFDMIAQVDEFVLFDDMQFTRRDWRNRNQIKTPQGLQWLTVPVQSKGNYFEAIKNIRVEDQGWAAQHWKTVRLNYAKAPYFDHYAARIEALYESAGKEQLLSRVNATFLRGICEILGISTPLTWSMDYQITDGKNERLISICRQAGASHYLSGPAARDYLDESAFAEAGVVVEWMDYSNYKPYAQRFGEFTHGVSVLDVLFNVGPEAPEYIRRQPASTGAESLQPQSAQLPMPRTLQF
jgi:hypothetical protein